MVERNDLFRPSCCYLEEEEILTFVIEVQHGCDSSFEFSGFCNYHCVVIGKQIKSSTDVNIR